MGINMGNQLPPVYLRSDVLLTGAGADCNRRGTIKLTILRDGVIRQRSFFFKISQIPLSPTAMIDIWDDRGIFLSFSSKDKKLRQSAKLGRGEKVIYWALSFAAVQTVAYNRPLTERPWRALCRP